MRVARLQRHSVPTGLFCEQSSAGGRERGDARRCHPGALRDPARTLPPGRGQMGKGSELGGGTGRWSSAVACAGGVARAQENVFRIFRNACAGTRRRSEVRDAAGRSGSPRSAACSRLCGAALHTAPPPARTPSPRRCRGRARSSLLPSRPRPPGAAGVKAAAALCAEGYGAGAANVVLRLRKQKNVRLRETHKFLPAGGERPARRLPPTAARPPARP